MKYNYTFQVIRNCLSVRPLTATPNETLIMKESYKAEGRMFIHTEMPPLSENNVVIT